MGIERKIDDFIRPSNAQPQQPKPSYDSSDEKHLRGMRWLYDNDAEYQRAKKKLAAELAREKIKKQLAKKARLDKVSLLKNRFSTHVKKLPITTLKTTKSMTSGALRKKNRKKLLLGAIGLAFVSFLLFGVVFRSSNNNKVTTEILGSSQQNIPTFDTLEPGNDITRTKSGQLAFDPSKDVASYTDVIAETVVTVSQQPLPATFQNNPTNELATFAQGINATEKLEIGEVVAYLGMSEKGPQTIVFIKNQKLLFITAEKKLPSVALFEYIRSLQ